MLASAVLVTARTSKRFVCVCYFAKARSYVRKNSNYIQTNSLGSFNITFPFEVNISYNLFNLCNVLKYNNINSQLDTTITDFIDNYNQLNMFRAMLPACRQHRWCIIPQAVNTV